MITITSNNNKQHQQTITKQKQPPVCAQSTASWRLSSWPSYPGTSPMSSSPDCSSLWRWPWSSGIVLTSNICSVWYLDQRFLSVYIPVFLKGHIYQFKICTFAYRLLSSRKASRQTFDLNLQVGPLFAVPVDPFSPVEALVSKTLWIASDIKYSKASKASNICVWYQMFQISPMVLGLPEEPKKKQ